MLLTAMETGPVVGAKPGLLQRIVARATAQQGCLIRRGSA
jgi:hypothetical protein